MRLNQEISYCGKVLCLVYVIHAWPVDGYVTWRKQSEFGDNQEPTQRATENAGRRNCKKQCGTKSKHDQLKRIVHASLKLQQSQDQVNYVSTDVEQVDGCEYRQGRLDT